MLNRVTICKCVCIAYIWWNIFEKIHHSRTLFLNGRSQTKQKFSKLFTLWFGLIHVTDKKEFFVFALMCYLSIRYAHHKIDVLIIISLLIRWNYIKCRFHLLLLCYVDFVFMFNTNSYGWENYTVTLIMVLSLLEAVMLRKNFRNVSQTCIQGKCCDPL